MDILEKSDHQLRHALDEITESLPIEAHLARVAALRSAQPHRIERASASELAGISLDKYTCFMYAFDLAASTAVIEIAQTFKQTYPSSDFVAYLVAHHLWEVSKEKARDGDVVLYSDSRGITHAGKLRAGRVVSKWGTGYLWEHDVAEVPAKYGHDVKFYRALPGDVTEEAFVAYARKREGAKVVDLLLGR